MPSSAERRQWRRRLRKLYNRRVVDIASGKVTGYTLCAYPACEHPSITECCYEHSINDRDSSDTFLDNDGIIDWQAIDVARKGERVVRLTWVEFEIAAAYILLDGGTYDEMRERTGVTCRNNGPRIDRIKEVADALRAAA